MSKPLRRIGDPVVAAGRAGVRIRTRIHPSAGQAAALTAIGGFLGWVVSQRVGRAGSVGACGSQGAVGVAGAAQAGVDGGVVVAVGGGDHPRCGRPVPAGDTRVGGSCQGSGCRGGGVGGPVCVPSW
jgi:hypothetical protein